MVAGALGALPADFLYHNASATPTNRAADGAALEVNQNPFAVVVLAHLKTLGMAYDDEARRAAEVRLVKGLYERRFTADRIRQLYRVIDAIVDLPKPLARLAWKEIYDFAKEKNMSFVTGAELVVTKKDWPRAWQKAWRRPEKIL